MADSSSQEDFGDLAIESVIRGHHIYKQVWTPFVGEELTLNQEYGNTYDHFATTVERRLWLLVVFPENYLDSSGLS